MRAALQGVKKLSRFGAFAAKLQERLARSSRVFLIGLIVACGIEVLVDWSSTLREVTVLRDRMRERGTSYATMLASSLEKPLQDRNKKELARLSDGLFDDDEVGFVRVTDAEGNTVHERVSTDYARVFQAKRRKTFADFYGKQIERDVKGMLKDPEALKRRVESSRHRDFAQAWNDFFNRLARRFTGEARESAKTRSAYVVYQDRLYDEQKDFDPTVTYAMVRIDTTNASGQAHSIGVAIVAFDMTATNAQISGKYLKGLGIVVFFVGLILVQNVLSRREKLRLFDLEERHKEARAALSTTFPAPIDAGGLRVSGAVSQSKSVVDGLAWDAIVEGDTATVLLVDPQGDGVDVAALTLQVRSAFRKRREERVAWDSVAEIAALGEAVSSIPLSRPVGIVAVRVQGDRVDGIASPVGGARLLAGDAIAPLQETPESSAPNGVAGPLRRLSAQLAAGTTLVIVSDGLAGVDKRIDVDAVVQFLRRDSATVSPVDRVGDAVTWARGRSSQLDKSDLAVVAVQRLRA